MSSVLKSVAYSYISNSDKPFSFDAIAIEDGKVVLDIHRRLATKEEFYSAIEGVIPIFTSETAEVVRS